MRGALLSAALLVSASAASAQVYATNLPLDDPAIRYWTGTLDNPVTRLDEAAVPEKFDLARLLDLLRIGSDSQALVFSKTSFQAAKISPRNPRAIYFNDDVAVAWVRGNDSLEVAATDPRQGVIFYQTAGRKFLRSRLCLSCHQGAATQGVPGMFVGSVYPDSSGMPHGPGAIITDHRTAFADRWGGWYVNARSGEQSDRANGVSLDPAEPLTLNSRQNLASLEKLLNTDGYLTPVSDIVALMTFEHQTQANNLLIRLGWKARLGNVEDADIAAVARYLTFGDETPLKEPIVGVSDFTKTFAKRGPFDRQGRGLRQFDLQTRLFRYPLSYMIYSAVFDALPDALRDKLYRRIFAELRGSPETLEILRETKTDLPAGI